MIKDKFIEALANINFLSMGDKPLVYIEDETYTTNDILDAIKNKVRSGVKEIDDKRDRINGIVGKGLEYLEEIIK